MNNSESSEQTASKTIDKPASFPNKVLIINGWEGCGKTCISNIIKALNHAENMKYSLEFEIICHLWLSNNLDHKSAATSLSTFSDHMIYNQFQSREINIRPADLSSIFRSAIWFKYILRLFSKGGEDCVGSITEDTILNLVTHNLFQCRELLKNTFKDRLIFIEVARDPLYMLTQLKYNQDTLYGLKNSPRNFTLNYQITGRPIVDGLNSLDEGRLNNWEEAYNFLERRMHHYFNYNNKIYKYKNPFFIFFEDFVKDPNPYISKLESDFSVNFNHNLKATLKREKIPRSDHSDGKDTQIYRKVGWVKLKKSNHSDTDSYISHYKSLGVGDKTIKKLVKLSNDYKEWKSSVIS